MKKLTNRDFISKVSDIHNNFYDYSKVDYTGTRNKIIILCPIHGEFEQMAQSHMKGCGCAKCAGGSDRKRRIDTEGFIKRANITHNNFYSYSKTNYIRGDKKVLITCPIHQDFLQTPQTHLQGSGCSKCAFEKNTYTTESFIKKANIVHNYKYCYEKSVYTIGRDKITITCKKHGDFIKRADTHLEGSGCQKCGREDIGGYSKTIWMKKAKERICTFYTLRCFNENEEFYKIGRTMNTVKVRYPNITKMPYNYEIVSEVHGEAGFIWELELAEKRKLKDFNYQPVVEFKGSKTECFTQYIMNETN